GGLLGWRQLNTLRVELSQREVQLTANLVELRDALQKSEQRAQAQLAAQVQRLDGGIAALDESVRQLFRLNAPEETRWALAEVEFLLLTANYRLLLEQNVRGAVQTLSLADERIGSLNDARLTPVRRRIAEHLRAVKGAGETDVAGIGLRLAAAAMAVESLSLRQGQIARGALPAGSRGAEQSKPGHSVSEKSFLDAVWADMKQLVQVRRMEDSPGPLVMPEEAYFLRQNLRLELEGARFAALRWDTANFRQSLGTAKRWLNQHFDPRAPQVAALDTDLEQMLKTELRPTMPDISGALRLLRQMDLRSAATKADTAIR
ncbi:MAG: hypothetical protein DRQ37_03370, partial [Gammaproteobacteria bacterium]